MKQQFLSWWTGLQQREQQLVAGAAVVVVIGLFYWLLWQPLHQAKQTQQQKLQTAQHQLSQLQQLIPQLKAAGAAPARTGGSLAQIISNSARSGGIKVSRMQPQNEQLTLVLEDVSFEQLLSWLHALQYQHGVTLVNVDLATADKPGIVRVRRMVVE
ncbi:type II secretion system protein M [Rheinheimera sp.]|uniref:type II secretion system protein M n=1 Tax=Rheinheimera sp. TaxID=1869214 RepID=UPI002732A9BC|nr:type II secretion system protein M [Rheinheimera sp.]MDP2716863.1 type II secretion system protein M [Rheinheimera sp.]